LQVRINDGEGNSFQFGEYLWFLEGEMGMGEEWGDAIGQYEAVNKEVNVGVSGDFGVEVAKKSVVVMRR
jgi:hypothetical protein